MCSCFLANIILCAINFIKFDAQYSFKPDGKTFKFRCKCAVSKKYSKEAENSGLKSHVDHHNVGFMLKAAAIR